MTLESIILVLDLNAVAASVQRETRLAKLAVSTVALGATVLADSETVDAQEGGDTVDNENSPVAVQDEREDEEQAQVPQLEPHGEGNADAGQVDQESTEDQGSLHDGPVRKLLLQQMGQNNHGGHAAEDERDSHAEQNEVVLSENAGVGGEHPQHTAEGEADHGNPLLEKGGERQALLATSHIDIVDTAGKVGQEEAAKENGDPQVLDGVIAEDSGDVDKIGDGLRPDTGAPDAGGEHDRDANEKTLGGAIEVAQVQGVGVEGLPGREVHGETRHNGGPCTQVGSTQAHSRSLQETGKSAVQRVDSVTVVGLALNFPLDSHG